MSAITLPEDLSDLPSLVDHAAKALANARTSAEVLQAKELAGTAYDHAKRIGRLVRAQKAHDDLLRAAREVQGDAAEIEHGAIARLAEEYSAAQERGEVGKSGSRSDLVPIGNEVVPSAADLGLSRKTIHQGRMIRDAEQAQPGIVHRTVKDLVDRGEEPTKAAIGRVVTEAAGRLAAAPRVPASHLAASSAPASKLKPPTGEAFVRFIELADEMEGLRIGDVIAGAGRQRSVLGQRASGLADMMNDIMEGCGQ